MMFCMIYVSQWEYKVTDAQQNVTWHVLTWRQKTAVHAVMMNSYISTEENLNEEEDEFIESKYRKCCSSDCFFLFYFTFSSSFPMHGDFPFVHSGLSMVSCVPCVYFLFLLPFFTSWHSKTSPIYCKYKNTLPIYLTYYPQVLPPSRTSVL